MKRPANTDRKQLPAVRNAPEQPLFVTWAEGDERGRAVAFHEASKALSRAEPLVQRAQGSLTFQNIAPGNVSVRDGFDKRDYDYFRPEDATPRTQRMMIQAVMQAYEKIGLVRNVIDLMADFACQGVQLLHPNPRVQDFYQAWFRKVGGKDRSERFLNMLYRTANVVIRRHTATLKLRDQQNLQKGIAGDVEAKPPLKLPPREIPWQYTVMNPLNIEVMGGELAQFVGADAFVYAVKLPDSLVKSIRNPKTAVEKKLVAQLPAKIRQAIQDGSKLVPLESDKVEVLYYKRDDWQVWATPMLGAVLDDLIMLKKMKLADLAALDGAISHIRIWKLGNIEARILPTEAAINRLAEILSNNVGGGTMDLVWGPELELQETSTELQKFLGATKYEPVLTAIYAGLGIPPTLTGASTASGFTNNYISLKTLCERLQYGRDVLTDFWEKEVRLVQQAMGFRQPATVRFDRMTLTDEAAEKKLLMDLLDRDVISDETVLERFGEDPEIESYRKRREMRRRDKGILPRKASPYHEPQHEEQLQKILAQSGAYTPGELGVDMDAKKSGEKSPLDVQGKQAEKMAQQQAQDAQSERDHEFRTEKIQLQHGVHPGQLEKQAMKHGVPGQGRPKNSKDSGKRKQKTVRPRTSAAFVESQSWANAAYDSLREHLAPAFLQGIQKANLRQLTAEEARSFERLAFAALCNLPAHSPCAREDVAALVQAPLPVPYAVDRLVAATVARHLERTGSQPSLERVRQFQAAAVALYRCDEADGVNTPEETTNG